MRYLTALFVLVVGTSAVGAQDPGHPRYEDYPASVSFRGQPASVDLASAEGAARFRTRLRAGARQGPNFAGAYTIVTWGCGTSCQSGTIIDARTGRVWWLPESLTRGVDFRLESRLLVQDPLVPAAAPHESSPIKYWEWTGDRLVLVASIPVHEP
jgi:hypothetical protein